MQNEQNATNSDRSRLVRPLGDEAVKGTGIWSPPQPEDLANLAPPPPPPPPMPPLNPQQPPIQPPTPPSSLQL